MSKKFFRNAYLALIFFVASDPTTAADPTDCPHGRIPQSKCSNRLHYCQNKGSLAPCGELNAGAHPPSWIDFQIGCTNNPVGENKCNQVLKATNNIPSACAAGVNELKKLSLCY